MSRAEYQRQWRRRRMERTGERIVQGRFTTSPARPKRASFEEPPHGTTARYNWRAGGRCRCDDCRAAHAEYRRELRARRRSEASTSDQDGAS